MMPAKLQEVPPVPASAEPTSGAGVGFGKVLNSIQGLQQRLDDFSVEEVVQAHARAESLIQELSSIQSKLAILQPLKQLVADTDQALSEIPEENSSLAELSNLEKYPLLNVVLTAAHQLQQAVRACPEKLTRTELAGMIALPGPRTKVPPAAAAPDSLPVFDHSKQLGSGVDEKARPNANAGSWRDADFSVRVDEASSIDAGEVPVTGESNSLFDQRLINDVIQSYGDFAGMAKNLSVSKKPKISQTRAVEIKSVPSTIPGRQTSLVETQISKTSLPEKAKAKSAPMPKVAPAEIIPIMESQPSKPVKESLPSVNRHGELDRQLKNIIKDYGEYDLYPRHNTMNVKIASI